MKKDFKEIDKSVAKALEYPKYNYSMPGSPIADDQKIPSELILGHLKRFMMIQMESLAYGMTKPEKVRADLNGVQYFVM